MFIITMLPYNKHLYVTNVSALVAPSFWEPQPITCRVYCSQVCMASMAAGTPVLAASLYYISTGTLTQPISDIGGDLNLGAASGAAHDLL